MTNLLTDKHAFYLLAAFSISTAILLLNIWWPLKQQRKIVQQIKQNNNELSS